MQTTINELKTTAKEFSKRNGVTYKYAKDYFIRETHFCLTAIGTPRRIAGNKLGLRKRFELAAPELAKRFPSKV